MDQALIRFRKAAARANHDRHGLQRRYAERLQRQAVEYWRAQQRQGEGLRDVAVALGVAPWSLYRWTRSYDNREHHFREVQVVASVSPPRAVAPVVTVTADGLRVEGLDIEATAQLLRLLR
jgi:hypothetical protein